MKKYDKDSFMAHFAYDKIKLSITVILVVCSFVLPKVGFIPLGYEGFDLVKNILFPLCHANIFHLMCNLLCIWMMRKPYYLIPAIAISFVCSLLPEINAMPIMGCSGVLFAIVGAKYGRYGMLRELIKNTWLFFVITAFIPNVACLFHLYCVIMGFFYGQMLSTYLLWERTTKTCL